jgi:hypothetical protein
MLHQWQMGITRYFFWENFSCGERMNSKWDSIT